MKHPYWKRNLKILSVILFPVPGRKLRFWLDTIIVAYSKRRVIKPYNHVIVTLILLSLDFPRKKYFIQIFSYRGHVWVWDCDEVWDLWSPQHSSLSQSRWWCWSWLITLTKETPSCVFVSHTLIKEITSNLASHILDAFLTIWDKHFCVKW